MALKLFRITRSGGTTGERNQVREVLVNEDDGQSDAAILIALNTNMNAAQPVEEGAEPVYPSNYFDTVTLWGTDPSTTPLDTDGDFIAFQSRVFEVIAP